MTYDVSRTVAPVGTFRFKWVSLQPVGTVIPAGFLHSTQPLANAFVRYMLQTFGCARVNPHIRKFAYGHY